MLKNFRIKILEIFSTAKYLRSEKITQTHTCARAQCNGNQEIVATCSYTYLEFAMLNLTYFKPKNDLPNPKGPLSLSIPSQAIALASRDVATKA